MNLADKCRTVAAYHGSTTLAAHAKHLDDVVHIQRAALLEAADRLEQLEAEAARLRADAATVDDAGRVAGVVPVPPLGEDPCRK
jgi:hypothetical protein